MCLITYFKEGQPKYGGKVEAFLRQGAESNDEGSGYMFKKKGDNKIVVDKGYFNVDLLLESLKARGLKDEDELVVHHRICTVGKVSPENCHPFVLSDNPNIVAATQITTKKPCLVHNGGFSKLYKYIQKNSHMSDTYAFTRYIMSNKGILKMLDEDRDLFNFLLDDIVNSSRVVIMYPDKPTNVIGHFYDDEGYMHSNLGYCDYRPNHGGRYLGQSSHSNNNVRSNDTHVPRVGHGSQFDFQEFMSRHGGDNGLAHWNGDDDQEFPDQPGSNEILPPVEQDENLGEVMGKIGRTNQEVLSKVIYFKCKHVNNKAVRLLLLDSNTVHIDQTNFNRFYYIEKGDLDTALLTNDYDVATIEFYYNTYQFVSLDYKRILPGSNKLQTKTDRRRKDVVDEAYYYIPKSDYTEMYSDYMRLVGSTIHKRVGISTLKKIEKKLYDTRKRNESALVKFTRLGKNAKVTRGSLLLFKDFVEKKMKFEEEKLKKEEAYRTFVSDREEQETLTEWAMLAAKEAANDVDFRSVPNARDFRECESFTEDELARMNISKEEARVLGISVKELTDAV
jgi:hypothetical protein